MPIRNIIFDLGGVIINLDYKLTIEAFRSLGAYDIDKIYEPLKQGSLFDELETGKIQPDEFRKRLKEKLDLLHITDAEFDKAWNAMLLDLPLERLNFLKELGRDYNVFLYSNTNSIHLDKILSINKELNGFASLAEFFKKEYYSHQFGFRKPHADSFTKLLEDSGLKAEETVFIDDNYDNVLGAKQAGIHSFHLTKNNTITDILDFIKQINSAECVPSQKCCVP